MTRDKTRSAAAGASMVLAAAAVFFGAVGGCEDRGSPTASGGAPRALPAPDATYTTRGRIDALPASPGGTMRIHHEAVPDFRNQAGAVVGMGSMTMPFMPAPGLDITGLAAGDSVEFTWEMRWNSRPNSLIVRMVKLPAGTGLTFGPAPPRGETPK
jgi:hypothetical protein